MLVTFALEMEAINSSTTSAHIKRLLATWGCRLPGVALRDTNSSSSVLELCREAGLVKLGHVALDSTKVRANASKHKAITDG